MEKRKLKQVAAVLALITLVATSALAADELKLRIFDNPVRGAFVAGDPLASSAADALIETESTGSACGSLLYRWADSIGPREGMVVRAEQTPSGADPSTFFVNACQRPLAKVIADETTWPKCPAPTGSTVYYWVADYSSLARCLVQATTSQNDQNDSTSMKPVMDIWALPAVPEGTQVVAGLSELFDSTAHPRAMRNMGFRPCHLWHLAATGMPQQDAHPYKFTAPSTLRWSAYYLVDIGAPYTCESGERSSIDLLNRPLGRLGDGSAFIAGQRSVLAVEAYDGKGAPNPRLRRIDPEQLIEDLRVDGGPECSESADEAAEAACKWIRDARGRQGSVLQGKEGMRLWYQAFESAVRRIYFRPLQ